MTGKEEVEMARMDGAVNMWVVVDGRWMKWWVVARRSLGRIVGCMAGGRRRRRSWRDWASASPGHSSHLAVRSVVCNWAWDLEVQGRSVCDRGEKKGREKYRRGKGDSKMEKGRGRGEVRV